MYTSVTQTTLPALGRFIWIPVLILAVSVGASPGDRVIAQFAPNAMFIEGSPSFSPDGSRLAFGARDGRNLRGNVAHLWVGSTSGNFQKVYAQPVRHVQFISNQEIAFQDMAAASSGSRDMVVRAYNLNNGQVRELYRRTPAVRNGWDYEILNLFAISSTGAYMVLQDPSGFAVIRFQDGARLTASDFQVSFDRNSRVIFSTDDSRVLVFEGRSGAFSLYAIGAASLQKVDMATPNLSGLAPSSYFQLNGNGNMLLTAEQCSGDCYYQVFHFNTGTGAVQSVGTIRGGQIVSLGIGRDLRQIIRNIMHRQLILTTVQ